MATVLRLHVLENKRCFTLEQIVNFIVEGDLGCLSSRRRADIIEAFSDRGDVPKLVPILVEYLVMEGVLISEYVHADALEMYRINGEEIPTLDNFHASLERGKPKSAKLQVVS